MLCGSMYPNQCTMTIHENTNNNWNCDNKISECWVDDEETLIIRCNDRNLCINQNITCIENNDNDIPDGGCRIICDGDGVCTGSNILCSAPKCEIICHENGSCDDINNIECGLNTDREFEKECNIECIGDGSCLDLDFICNELSSLRLGRLSLLGLL